MSCPWRVFLQRESDLLSSKFKTPFPCNLFICNNLPCKRPRSKVSRFHDLLSSLWMAKTNKYTSINFNDFYDKKISSSSSSTTATQKSCYLSAASRSHGMLVLSRPSSKPIAQPQSYFQSPPPSLPAISPPLQNPPPAPVTAQSVLDRGSISLRPSGTTGPVLETGKKEPIVAAIATPKSDKFVPPHLRPGFVVKEERPSQIRPGSSGGHGSGSSPSRFGEDRRPKSGGGYGRRVYLDSADLNRPRSWGNRPNSSG